jgi:hypothetical protein
MNDMPMNLNRRDLATVPAGLHLLVGDGVRVPNYPRTSLAGLAPDAQTDYELRHEAGEDYIRQLIERINEIGLRGAHLCRRCTSKYPGKWEAKLGRTECANCGRVVTRFFIMTKPVARLL